MPLEVRLLEFKFDDSSAPVKHAIVRYWPDRGLVFECVTCFYCCYVIQATKMLLNRIASLSSEPEWLRAIFCNSELLVSFTCGLPNRLPNLWISTTCIFFQVISAGGFYVLGQEQDELAGNFSANEAFIGQMSQLNIWSYELPASDIADMARHAENFLGNVIGWSDFYDPADTGIKKIEPSVARTGKLHWVFFQSC